ncbi:hypothetical protein P22_2288 [Propionispora sp. 2/2-37]|uniref:hypothetical protein n=1 Tax=Propionispora sp. 2/2-37 TaxID=1677858 RepID=UPI0006C4B63C|nr:hypothetical protein [Propionispora sp. 2/2-37]CUH96199.1 hypothetical protein P22_2288 [Propionispora sp. 2/2-37]
MHVLLIFIDGVGLGENNSAVNPFARYSMPLFQKIFGGSLTRSLGKVIQSGGCLVPTDAGLGVTGLPQSASGQTTLFTGINAARVMGMHVHAFPGPRLAELIAEAGIMKRLLARGFQVTSANMYAPDYMNLVAARKRRHAATTLVVLTAGQPLRSSGICLTEKRYIRILRMKCCNYPVLKKYRLFLRSWQGNGCWSLPGSIILLYLNIFKRTGAAINRIGSRLK